ncbi:MAG: ribonuclease H-like YkuK family protein, partial [Ginsengibacter sp.]
MLWRKFNGDPIEVPVKSAVEKAIQNETKAGYKLKVCIGTDSQVKGTETEFATVIVFLREGRGGFMFIHNEKTKQNFSIKERMLVEVAKSIEIAYELCDLFTLYDVDMEVHADINT